MGKILLQRRVALLFGWGQISEENVKLSPIGVLNTHKEWIGLEQFPLNPKRMVLALLNMVYQ